VVSEAGSYSAAAAETFTGQLVVLNTPLTITVGLEIDVDIGASSAVCHVTELQHKVDRRSGKVLEVSPSTLKAGEVGFVTFEPQSPICVEAAVDVPTLGRFCVRDDERLAAVGCVRSVVTRRRKE
jgi:elongation factor 1-alpha